MEQMQNTIVMDQTFYQNLEVIYQSLYLPRLTDYLTDLISAYVEAYYEVLKASEETEKTPEMEILLRTLSGPIEEIFNPSNPRMTDGNTYPAVEIIKARVNAHENASSNLQKAPVRSLTKPGLPPVSDHLLGFKNVKFIIFGCIVLGILLFALYQALK